MSEYTPTTDEVREAYRRWKYRFDSEKGGPEFDRWLATHDAEVAARALEEAADAFERKAADPALTAMADKYAGYYAGVRSGMQATTKTLRAEAARLREGKEQ